VQKNDKDHGSAKWRKYNTTDKSLKESVQSAGQKSLDLQKGRDFVNLLDMLSYRGRELQLMPDHNFIGPGTKLDNTLKVDGTPKSWSRLINCVDSAAYRHDLAYARHADTAERIFAYKKMRKELDAIPNPTLKERMKRTVVKPILKTKVDFGFWSII